MKTIFKIVLTIMIIGLTLSSIIGYQLGRRWNIRQVGYRIYQGLVDYGWVQSINNAARTWCNAGANFQFNHIGYSTSMSYGQDGVNIVTYTNWNNNPEWSAFSLRYPLGSNDPIEECDMVFNLANRAGFATNGSPYRMDVESVALHEFGHWLALEHENSIPEAVMYGTLNAGQIKRVLHADDIAGIKALYGNRPNDNGCGGGGGSPCTRVFLAGQIIAEYVFAQTINQELYTPGSYGEDLLMHVVPDCDEPVRILDEHPELLAELNSLIMANLDYVESQLTNNPKTLTREQIDEISRLIYRIIEYSSPELQESLFRLVVYLEKSEGKTFKQAVEDILAGRTTVSEEEIDGMVQNYPNPFNPVTTIRFRLNRDDNIDINVYDITGKRIRTLANGFYKAGIYNVVFDGSDLSSGIYLYEFRTSKKVNVKKMLLLK